MACGEDETVTVGELDILWVGDEELLEESVAHWCTAHWETWVTRVGLCVGKGKEREGCMMRGEGCGKLGGENVIERGVPGKGAHSIRNGHVEYTYGVDTINSQETDSCRREKRACQKRCKLTPTTETCIIRVVNGTMTPNEVFKTRIGQYRWPKRWISMNPTYH